MGKKRLGDLLVEKGLLSKEEVERAIASQGGSQRLGEILAANKTVSKSDLGASLEAINGMPYIECPPSEIDPEVLARIPARLAARSCALPVAIRDKVLIVAMGEPQNLALLEELEFAANIKIQPRFSFRSDVVAGIRQFYGEAAGPSEALVVPKPGPGRLNWAVRIAVAAGFCIAAVGAWQAAAIVRGSLGTFSLPAILFSSPASLETAEASEAVAVDGAPLASNGSDTAPLPGSTPSMPEVPVPPVPTIPVAPVADDAVSTAVPVHESSRTSIVDPVDSAPGSEVQVGVFRNVTNAQVLVDSLRNAYEDVEMTRLSSGLYMVCVGPFAEKAVADRVASEIQAETGLAPLVRRTRIEQRPAR